MPLSFPRLPPKDVLAAKLIDYPFLNSILRMLLYERLFRFVLIALVLLVVAIPLFVGKIITATPKGFIPALKISGLDYAQAWSLRRTALQQAAAGRFDDALYSWRVAVANNPADATLLRECLNHVLQSSDKRKCAPVVVTYSRWLMRLTGTNQADLTLSVNAYQHFGLDDLTIQTLSPLARQLNPALEASFLRALFNRSRFTQFAERWQDAKLRDVKFSDSSLALYNAAYEAGWGLLSDANRGRGQLERAKADPATRTLAHRLQLKVSEHLVEPEVYKASLDVLQEWRLDRLEDHIGYWQLLASVGRKAEAVQLINAHVTPPVSGEETVLLAKAHFDLGLGDKSRQILEQYAPEFSDSEPVWLSYSNLLIQQKRWSDLGKAALLIRHEDNPFRDTLASYSYYLEGLAELGEGRPERALLAFKKIAATRVKNPIQELMLAEKVALLGYAAESKEILVNLQDEHKDQPGFWLFLARMAFDAKDPDVLVSALASAHKLRPDDAMIMNNYAAALLSTRQRPEEALRLTSDLVQKSPAALGPRINHTAALLQNQRVSEAEAELKGIDVAKLSGAELSSYQFALFEAHFVQQHYAEAKEASARIDPQFLLPPEKQWLERARRQMEPAAPATKS